MNKAGISKIPAIDKDKNLLGILSKNIGSSTPK